MVVAGDGLGEWALFNYTTGAVLANGSGFSTYMDLQGNTMIATSPTSLEVHSATTGQLLGTIPAPTLGWYQLATDGSYVATGNNAGLTVWSPAGQMLFAEAGDYSAAAPFAAPGQLLIANGAAGSVIQTFTVPGGVASLSPQFQGIFSNWFADGQHFLTSLNNNLWVYSAAAVQQQFFTPAGGVGWVGGSGNWFWVTNNELSFYAIGSTTPAYSVAFSNAGPPIMGATTLTMLQDAGGATIIDLSGAAPVATTVATSSFPPFIIACGSFAALSPSQWVCGGLGGIILDGASLSGTPRSLTLGAALSIAAGTSYISIATAIGKIFVFNSSDDSLATTIDFPAGQLAASLDGTVLAAATNLTVNVYSLPSGTVTNSITYPSGTELNYLTMSASATVIGEIFGTPTTGCLAEVIPVAGGPPIFCDNTGSVASIDLSPDGTLIAASGPVPGGANIYKNGTLITAVPDFPVGWLSNNELLADDYTEPGIGWQPDGTTLYDASGDNLGAAPFKNMGAFQLVPGSTSLIYDITHNEIVSLTSGATTWLSAYPNYGSTGGVTSSQVVFVSGNQQVLAQPY